MSNWAIVSAMASLLGIVATLVSVAYISGQLTQKIKENCEALTDHDVRLDKHDERLGDHSVKLGQLREWKDGFNAGSKSSTSGLG